MTVNKSMAIPLLVDTQPHPEEGFHGLLARATHRNRLGHAKIIFEDVGLILDRQGLASQRIDDQQTAAIAVKLGCDEAALDMRRTPSVGNSHIPLLKWGSTVIRSSDLLALRRRLCPETMAFQGWLPAQWSLKHLPFCADCFAPLVDRCDKCGKQLGWGTARGVAACAACRKDVVASSEPRLSATYREDYRLLSDLSSIDDRVRQAGLGQLPEPIASLDLHQILDLALGLGQALTLEGERLRRIEMKLPVHVTAATYSTGLSILKGWPRTLIERGEAFVAEGRDQEQHFWRTLKRLRHSGTKHRFPGSFLRAELPGLLDDRRLSVAGLLYGVIGSRELQDASGLQMPQIRRLCKDGVFGTVHATGDKAKSFQIDREIGEVVTRIFRDTIPLHAAANRIGVPVYCVEQLACLGELEAVDHSALSSLESAPRIRSDSVENFLARVADDFKDDRDGHGSCISLRRALSALYCGEKPYAKLLSLMLKGGISAHLEPAEHKRSAALLSRILLDPAAIEKQAIPAFDFASHPFFRFSETYTKRDAADVLSVRGIDVARATEDGQLVSKTGPKRSQLYDRGTIRSIAALHMSSAEFAHRTGLISRASAAAWARRHDLIRAPLGWPRQDTLLVLQRSGADARSL